VLLIRTKVVPKFVPWMTLICCNFKFSLNFVLVGMFGGNNG